MQRGQSDACAAATAAEGPPADPGEQPAAASLLPHAAGHLGSTLSPQCAPFSPIPHAGNSSLTKEIQVTWKETVPFRREVDQRHNYDNSFAEVEISERVPLKQGLPVFVLD